MTPTMPPLVTLTNSFHRTSTRVRPDADGTISRRQLLRARRALCGVSDCGCAQDDAGTRHSVYMVLSACRAFGELADERYDVMEAQ